MIDSTTSPSPSPSPTLKTEFASYLKHCYPNIDAKVSKALELTFYAGAMSSALIVSNADNSKDKAADIMIDVLITMVQWTSEDKHRN